MCGSITSHFVYSVDSLILAMSSSNSPPWNAKERSKGNCVLVRGKDRRQSEGTGFGDDIPAETGSEGCGKTMEMSF